MLSLSIHDTKIHIKDKVSDVRNYYLICWPKFCTSKILLFGITTILQALKTVMHGQKFMGNEEVTEDNAVASWGRVEYMILFLNGINPSGQNIIMLKIMSIICIFIYIFWGYGLSHIFSAKMNWKNGKFLHSDLLIIVELCFWSLFHWT